MRRCWYVGVALCWLCLGSIAAAADFVVKDLEGRPHSLALHKGKWVVINFWATWCPPCREEIPDLIALHEKRSDVVVIGVAMEYQNAKEIRTFVDDNLMSYPIVLGSDKIEQQIGPADALPTTYVYNPQGQLVKTRRGMVTRAYLEKLMEPSKTPPVAAGKK